MRKTREKKKTFQNVSTQNYAQMFNRKPVTENMELASLYFDAQQRKTSKAELGKDQHLLPAN